VEVSQALKAYFHFFQAEVFKCYAIGSRTESFIAKVATLKPGDAQFGKSRDCLDRAVTNAVAGHLNQPQLGQHLRRTEEVRLAYFLIAPFRL
jgi:hypothetical protein